MFSMGMLPILLAHGTRARASAAGNRKSPNEEKEGLSPLQTIAARPERSVRREDGSAQAPLSGPPASPSCQSPLETLVARFDIEHFSDFSAK